MIKLVPAETGVFHNFKCGEVFCLSTEKYSIACCLCGLKVDLEEFPKHFKRKHLSKSEEYAVTPETKNTKRMTRSSKKAEDDAFNETLLSVKPETEEVSAFSWDEHYDNDDDEDEFQMAVTANLGADDTNDLTNDTTNDASVEDEHNNKELDALLDIGELGAKTSAVFAEDDDDIFIGIENGEWLHEKYSYDDVKSLADDDEILDGLPVAEADIKVNIFDSDDNEDDGSEDRRKLALEQVPCEHCKRVFNSHVGLRIHIKATHERKERKSQSVPKPVLDYNCDECGEKFLNERTLKAHKYKHTGIFCDVCGKTFSQVGNMERHRIRHTGIKTIQCKECDKTFYTDRELKAHMMRHTGILPIICEICGKRCRDHGVLTAHMRRHTGERPAKCNVCGKAFFCGYDLNVHSVTHTTERPFKCDICGSTFQLKKSLRVHKKIHNKNRDHTCKICGKGFAQSSGLNSHMRMHDSATTSNSLNVGVSSVAASRYEETGDSGDGVAPAAHPWTLGLL